MVSKISIGMIDTSRKIIKKILHHQSITHILGNQKNCVFLFE